MKKILKIGGLKWVVFLFSMAFAFRLLLIFVVTRPEFTGWYGDAYHHWQIAYYTLHMGLKQNPPRMWDLNGMEYYWGILPTLVESLLLWVFNTASMLPFQIFNSMIGSLSVCLIYLLSKRHFSERVGIMTALLTAINPVVASTDISGMLESLGIFLLLFAIFFYDKRPFHCGLLLGLALMCRIEYYSLSVLILACYIAFERSGAKFVLGFAGWLTSSLPHFIFLQMGTGDWLYQVRWNLFSALGGWDPRYTMAEYQVLLTFPRLVSSIFLVLSMVCLFYLLKQTPRGYIFPAFFLLYSAFQFTALTFSSYLAIILFTPVSRFLMDRMFAINYIFVSWILAMSIEGFPISIDKDMVLARLEALKEDFYSGKIGQEEYMKRAERLRSKIDLRKKDRWIPSFLRTKLVIPKRKLAKFGAPIKLIMFILLIVVYLLSSIGVFVEYNRGLPGYEYTDKVASYVVSHYQGGTIISGSVFFNYHMINKGISYDKIVGSLYSPLYYGVSDLNACLMWLKRFNATWIFVDHRIYEAFPFLRDGGTHPPFYVVIPYVLYQVNQTELSAMLSQHG